jgi:hypothetical protein
MRYEIEDGTFAVSVFYDDNDFPSLYQPHWPSGQNWASAEEATAWAELYVESMVNPDAPYAPGAPGEEGQPKPTPEEIAALQEQLLADRQVQLEAAPTEQ